MARPISRRTTTKQQPHHSSTGKWSYFIPRVRDFVCILVGVILGFFVTRSSDEYLGGCPMPPIMATTTTINADTTITATVSATTAKTSSDALATTTSASSSLQIQDGFHPIHVYWGKFDQICQEIPTKWYLRTSPLHSTDLTGEWYGQHGQDVAIAKIFNFQRQGYFVDLAANDAVWASNTFGLEQNLDWKGICIEANPQYWYRLGFRKCHVVGAIVGSSERNQEVEVVLGAAHHGPYGGIVGDDFDNKRKAGSAPEKRYTVPLETILDMFQAPTTIDYLSLDVEGAESYIMKNFPFQKYKFLTLSVERPKDDLQALLQQNGYQKVMDIKRGDTLWAHQSIYDDAKARVERFPEEIHSHRVTQSKEFAAALQQQ